MIGVALIARVASTCYPLCDGHVDARLRNPDKIIRDRELLGLDEDELTRAIGKPAEGWHFSGWDQAYYVGSDGSCIDSKWLVVKFGNDGRVEKVGITND